jgi:hypothetical protein
MAVRADQGMAYPFRFVGASLTCGDVACANGLLLEGAAMSGEEVP